MAHGCIAVDSADEDGSPVRAARGAAPDSRGAPAGAVRVGRWTFDRSLNTLTCTDEVVRIEPKVADLLQAFLLRPGEVLSRADLLAAVWPGVVVGDEALSQSINKLRRALGDAPRDAAYLQTVPKRGYRLVAGVAYGDVAASTQAPARDERADGGVAAARTSGTPAIARNPGSAENAGAARTAAVARTAAAGNPSFDRGPDGAAGRRLGRRARALVVLAVAALLASGWLALARRDGDDLSAILARAAAPAGDQRSVPEVLVRPFDVIGPDPSAPATARAFWMQVVATVAQSSQLRVIAADRPAAALGQDAVPPFLYQVDGTVRQSGEQLAVHLVLSNTSSHLVLWSRRFDLPLSELSAGNQRAVGELLQALAVTLTESERQRLARPYTASAKAFQHFLAGQAAFSTRDPQSNLDARAHYHRALAEDPTFSRAMGGLALTHAADASFGWAADRRAAIRQALESARLALALDPEQPDAHWVLAWVELQDRRHAAALRHARQAIDLSPSYADAYALAATVASYTGRPADALVLMRVAIRMRPDANFLYHLVVGRAHFFLDDDAQAIASLGVSLRKNPAFLESRIYLAAALARSGRLDDAAWEAEEIRSHAPGFSARRWIGASLLTDRAEIDELARALALLPLEARAGDRGAAARQR